MKRTRTLVTATLGLALLSLTACSSTDTRDEATGDPRFDTGLAMMVAGIHEWIPAEYQDTICEVLPTMVDNDDIAQTRLYSSNDEEATAFRSLLDTVGGHGAEVMNVTTDESLERVFLGQQGVEAYCAHQSELRQLSPS